MDLNKTIRIVSVLGLVMATLAQPYAGSAVADEGVVAQATGSGHYTSGGELRTFGFSALRRSDGSASGQYQIISRAGNGVGFHVDVTCMSTAGNQAWVAGIITHSDDPAVIEGTVSYFRAIDNGEGNGPPDQVSPARINDRAGEDILFCTEQPTGLPLRNVEHGNVQVR